METIKTQVVIVGAGPAGLILALDLTRRGIKCEIIEKLSGLFPGSRGKGLRPRSIEILDDLGIVDEMLAAGLLSFAVRYYNKNQVVKETPAEVIKPVQGYPYPHNLLIPQWQIVEILKKELEKLGVYISFNMEFNHYTQNGDGVSSTVTNGEKRIVFHSDYLIGCDGGHSTVRREMGLKLEGVTLASDPIIIGDVSITGLAENFMHMWMEAGKIVMAITHFHNSNSWQFIGSAIAKDGTALEPSAENFQRIFDEFAEIPDVKITAPTWLSSIHQMNARIVNHYRDGRIFLAGDAAHVHSAFGGLGLNTSIQDVYNLGWKLSETIKGHSSPQLLDSYEEERLPVSVHVLGLTTELHKTNFSGSASGKLVKKLETITMGDEIDYCNSSLSLDDRTGEYQVIAGDRAPDGFCKDIDSGEDKTLFDIFRGPHSTMLLFGGNQQPIVEMIQRQERADIRLVSFVDGTSDKYPGTHRVTDINQNCRERYGIDKNAFVLIRPDGYIGLFSTTVNPETLEEYFSKRLCSRWRN